MKNFSGRAGAALALTSTLIISGPVAANTTPPAPDLTSAQNTNRPAADLLATPQINGVVWDQVASRNTVYFGGNFSSARPFGAKAGVRESARTHLGAYNLKTGALHSFAPKLNGEVKALAVSPDGSRLYVGGLFTKVNNQNRYRFAAFDTKTGKLLNFSPGFDYKVMTIAAHGDVIYVGGKFSKVGRTARHNTAAINAKTGQVLPWAPKITGGQVMGLAINPATGEAVLAGNFTGVNGKALGGWVAVDLGKGATKPWAANQVINNSGKNAAVYSITADKNRVYVTGYGFRTRKHRFEGVAAATWGGGKIAWIAGCQGDHYSVASTGSTVYAAGHAHDCGAIGGLPELKPRQHQRAIALSAHSPRGKINRGGFFSKYAAPAVHDWNPQFNIGTFTGQKQGPWDVTVAGDYILYGGEFTTVNGKKHSGLARFATKNIAPNKMGPSAPQGLAYQKVVGRTLQFGFTAGHDLDDGVLTYEFLRNNVVLDTKKVRSTWYHKPAITVTDPKPVAGHFTYKVRVTDPHGNVAYSADLPVRLANG